MLETVNKVSVSDNGVPLHVCIQQQGNYAIVDVKLYPLIQITINTKCTNDVYFFNFSTELEHPCKYSVFVLFMDKFKIVCTTHFACGGKGSALCLLKPGPSILQLEHNMYFSFLYLANFCLHGPCFMHIALSLQVVQTISLTEQSNFLLHFKFCSFYHQNIEACSCLSLFII